MYQILRANKILLFLNSIPMYCVPCLVPHIVLGNLGTGLGKYTPCQLGLRKKTPLCKIRKKKELFEDYQP